MDPKEIREQAIKGAKCGLILDAAQKLFSENGYMNTRLEDIAAAAGFSKPSLYSYYPDKESIFLSLAIRELQLMVDKIDTTLGAHGTFLQKIEATLRIIFSNFSQQFAYFMTATNPQGMKTMHLSMHKNNDLTQQLIDTFFSG